MAEEFNLDEKDFPSNSKLVRPQIPQEKVPPLEITQPQRTGKVISGRVTQKKKSRWQKFNESFFGETSKVVGSYILWDILIPAAKNTIYEMVMGGLEMKLFGEIKGRLSNSRRDRERSRVSYENYWDNERGHRDRRLAIDRVERRDIVRVNRSPYDFDDMLFESKADAQEVLETLSDLIEEYKVAKVSDFYDAIERQTTHIDYKFGWTNLGRASIERVRDGYILVLPRPIALDRE